MEGFLVLIYLIILVWGVLNIILFFKIWGMTNDIRELKLFILTKGSNPTTETVKENTSVSNAKEKIDNGFSPSPNRKINKGDTVINVSNGEQMIVNEIGFDGSCICYVGKKMAGIFQPNEIATEEEYSNFKK